MDGSIFFYVGGALVVAALAISAIGLRGKEDFPSRGAMIGILAAFAVLVVATGAFAWVNASDEQDKRDKELAEEQAQAAEGAGGGGEAQPAGGGTPAPAAEGAGETLDVTSPADGSTVFDPDALEAAVGAVTIVYENPSPVSHDIAVEDSEGQTLGETDLVTDGKVKLKLDLEPGDYVYFCTVPGHRESGMEGDLTVK